MASAQSNTRLEIWLSRMNCQLFSCELDSAHFAGKGTMEILSDAPDASKGLITTTRR
jgi:hypothetical protein